MPHPYLQNCTGLQRVQMPPPPKVLVSILSTWRNFPSVAGVAGHRAQLSFSLDVDFEVWRKDVCFDLESTDWSEVTRGYLQSPPVHLSNERLGTSLHCCNSCLQWIFIKLHLKTCPRALKLNIFIYFFPLFLSRENISDGHPGNAGVVMAHSPALPLCTILHQYLHSSGSDAGTKGSQNYCRVTFTVPWNYESALCSAPCGWHSQVSVIVAIGSSLYS